MIKRLIFAAHADDAVIGMGGTIAKHSKRGDKILTVIFTPGEKSHPHLKGYIVTRKRRFETRRVDKLLGRESMNLNLKEGKLNLCLADREELNRIKDMIRKFKPDKIYTLSSSDPHPDHRCVNKIVLKVLDELNYKKDVYSYEVWNIIEDNHPKVYEDITDEFGLKKQALMEYKSQRHFIYPLWLPVYYRARIYGKRHHCKFAEKFYKLR